MLGTIESRLAFRSSNPSLNSSPDYGRCTCAFNRFAHDQTGGVESSICGVVRPFNEWG